MSPIKFILPSRDLRGHAYTHESGNVTLTFMGGTNLSVTFSIGGMSAQDARTLGTAMTMAADQAEGLPPETTVSGGVW